MEIYSIMARPKKCKQLSNAAFLFLQTFKAAQAVQVSLHSTTMCEPFSIIKGNICQTQEGP